MAVLDRGYLGMGAETQAFETELSTFFDAPVSCVANGTAALHLALQAIGLDVGDEVLVQTITYVASFQAVAATGATPVACDVNPTTMAIDLVDAEAQITSRTKAIMLVHYAGGVGDLDAAYALAKKYNLRVIEDAAHAFGTLHNGVRVGRDSDIACFSFDGIKNITAGEGGCVVSHDKVVIDRVNDARLLGVERDTDARFSAQRSWNFDVTAQGWRYHMSDVMAAIGRAQLVRFDELATARQDRAKAYDVAFARQQRLQPLQLDYNMVVPHIYSVRVTGMQINEREKIMASLTDIGVQVGFHYKPNHLLSYFLKNNARPLPHAEATYPELLSLPLHPDMALSDISVIVEAVAAQV
jgi:dTDP-4-amino-4,6-dideoxygalactose transaminase